jgi:hypothetical protein
MSVAFFIGIRPSYGEMGQSDALAFIASIDSALRRSGLPGYSEPATLPDVYRGHFFGRSELDHNSALSLMELAEWAVHRGRFPHLSLLAENPYRVAFVPARFGELLCTDYSERIFGQVKRIWVGSAQALSDELTALATGLGIRLNGDRLPDAVAQQINDLINEPGSMHPGDDGSPDELRMTWLLLYEGARLAAEHGVALSLAG